MGTSLFEWLGNLTRRAAAKSISLGPIPKHIAFIMDGNRRYAEQKALLTLQGHTLGYQRLIQALEWCLDLGISCVSVYAFSIDNYRRSEEEVATLMSLAEDKLSHMLQEQDVLHKHQVQVRIVGDLSIAPSTVRAAAQKLVSATEHHRRAILNICLSYTSSRELQQALQTAHLISSDQWTSSTIDNAMSTQGCPPVDLLIRTSGESRLSDFMLRQSSHALLVFTRVLWPEFSFLDLVSAIMCYQSNYSILEETRIESKRAADHVWSNPSLFYAHTTTNKRIPQHQGNNNNNNNNNNDTIPVLAEMLSPLPTLKLKQHIIPGDNINIDNSNNNGGDDVDESNPDSPIDIGTLYSSNSSPSSRSDSSEKPLPSSTVKGSSDLICIDYRKSDGDAIVLKHRRKIVA